jgi:4-amino-4-deoxy-L-arabinose transferase-like glycosyltransferase
MQDTIITGRQRAGGGLWARHRRSLLGGVAAALALRLLFIFRFPLITPDGFLYGELAKNWLLHGVYGLSGAAGPVPSYIRVPGYPAFLAAIWTVTGLEHYNAVRLVQMFADVATCFVTADLARRTVSERAARAAFWLAALCPFLANYVALPLTETLAILCTVLALDFAVRGLEALERGAARTDVLLWTGCGLSIAAGLYLRPDGGIVLIAIGGGLLYRLARVPEQRKQTLWAGVLLGIFALGPLAPWTLRNGRVMHRWQALAPFHANDPWEFVPRGFERWEKTWLVDYASMEDIAFRAGSEPLQVADLPRRAFDDEDQRRRTEELFAAYNQTLDLTPALDAEFARLAEERIQRSPLRYYVWLPCLRALDLWLRPRTEMLPLDVHWWRYQEDARDFSVSVALGIVNLCYLLAAVAGAARGRVRFAGLLLAFLILRTVIIAAIAGPEPRYVLECYPVVIVFAGAALASLRFTVYVAWVGKKGMSS